MQEDQNTSITIENLPKTTRIMTPKQMRQQKFAEYVLAGASYPEMAADLAPDAKYPRQTMYSSVRQPGVQQAILQKLPYTQESLRAKVGKIVKKTRNDRPTSPQVRVLELAMRERGMLIDRSQSVSVNVDVDAKISNSSEDELIDLIQAKVRNFLPAEPVK